MCKVATRRTRTAGKVEIPNVDDHVSKLEHMGKETVKKLQDIKGSATQSGIDINVPENRIDKGECTPTQFCSHSRKQKAVGTFHVRGAAISLSPAI